MQPLLKWTGSKGRISKQIVSHFPDEIETYYEPFVGGGKVFFQLLTSGKSVKHFVLSDLNETLIQIYKIVTTTPSELTKSYRTHWTEFQKDNQYYYKQREIYNKTKDPLAFFFLTRTCYNGTIRFNSKGEFNVSFHYDRPGMHPDTLDKIVPYYFHLMHGRNIEFLCRSYEDVHPQNKNDVVYMDPPYTNTKSLYFGNIDLDKFFSWIETFPCSWFLNLNNINKNDNEESLPIAYTGKEVFCSGQSTFSKLKNRNVSVGEYFYWKV